jgi:hypothetical protein
VFAGTVMQMLALVVAIVAGIIATAEGYRHRTSMVVCRILGGLFVVMGLVVIARGGSVDPYHNLLHIATGLIGLYLGFFSPLAGATAFCLGSGAFYLALGTLGLVLGDASMDRMWGIGPLHLDIADHGFHLVLGTILTMSGLVTKEVAPKSSDASPGAAAHSTKGSVGVSS